MRVAEQIRLVFLVVTLGLGAVATPALAAPYAAVVMDMRNGEVLHARSADRKQHPASLTKMMTLYLTFEAVERGQLRLDQKVRVSRHAARQPASKLYLKSGQKVSIRHLIRATAIKSANDAAMVLAETVGGSQKSFARLMTQKARQLGMSSTTFKNPHGLTAQGHLSTARDMAQLARRLYFDFPQYYNVFGRVTAHAAGKKIWTTNRLLSAYRGAEGMKTGYTRAAGYNLVTTAARGEKRIIGVVMGGKSSRSRNRRMVELLDMGFARAGARVAMVKPRDGRAGVELAAAPMPPVRPGTRATGLAALAEVLSAAPAQAATLPVSAIAPLYTAPPRLRPGAPGALSALGEASLTTAPAPRPRWAIRLGAFDDRAKAVESITAVTLGNVAPLASVPSEINEIRSNGGDALYEVRFTGLAERQASKACSTLRSHGRECVAVKPH